MITQSPGNGPTSTDRRHEYDDDGCCIHCGFDGAEWWHWKRNTYEGQGSDLEQPECTAPRS